MAEARRQWLAGRWLSKQLIADIRDSFGPIRVLHWNAYTGGAGDLKTSSAAELRAVLNVAVHGLVAAVQAALPDLKAARGALLVRRNRVGEGHRLRFRQCYFGSFDHCPKNTGSCIKRATSRR